MSIKPKVIKLPNRLKQLHKDILKEMESLGIKTNESLSFAELVIDCSGSMGDRDKLDQAKNGAKNFVRKAIKFGYEIGLIKFSSVPTIEISITKDILALEIGIDALNVSAKRTAS